MTIMLKRGTRAQCLTYVAREGEPFVDLESKQLRIGDGTTPGGSIVLQIVNDAQGRLAADTGIGKPLRYFVVPEL